MHFNQNSDGWFGTALISEVEIPICRLFDPCAKIWSSARERNREKHKVDVAGLFTYDVDDAGNASSIACSFILSNTMDEQSAVYTQKFEGTFEEQMQLFCSTIQAFIEDQEVFNEYSRIVVSVRNNEIEKPEAEDKFNALFNDFLLKLGVKTEEDEKKKQKLKQKSQKVAAKSKTPAN